MNLDSIDLTELLLGLSEPQQPQESQSVNIDREREVRRAIESVIDNEANDIAENISLNLDLEQAIRDGIQGAAFDLAETIREQLTSDRYFEPQYNREEVARYLTLIETYVQYVREELDITK